MLVINAVGWQWRHYSWDRTSPTSYDTTSRDGVLFRTLCGVDNLSEGNGWEHLCQALCSVYDLTPQNDTTADDRTQAYFSAASELHSTQMKKMLSTYANLIKKVSEDTQEYGSWYSFANPMTPPHSHWKGFNSASTTNASKTTSGIRRAGTIIRSPIEGRQKEKDKTSDGSLRVSEVSWVGLSLLH